MPHGFYRLRCNWTLAALALLTVSVTAQQQTAPPQLSFDELVTLSKEATPAPALAAKMEAVLSTPVVVNRAAPKAGSKGPAALRVTEWNIERGENLDGIEQALTAPAKFAKAAAARRKLSPEAMQRLRTQAAAVRGSDVLILNEVDIGVKRTDYRNVVDELARALGMSSAYAVEFLEVDSLVSLGTESAVLDTPELSARMTEDLKPDRSRYRGLHVNAILSRYPMQNVRVLKLPVCHDWFNQERAEISQLEKGKRKAADLLFLERIAREVRRGNRNALVADIAVPGAGVGGQASSVRIVNAHLENKCPADCRNRQMKTVLDETSDSSGLLVMAGDLNTTGTDGTPTSVRYELTTRVKDYQFWTSTLLRFTPVGLPIYATAPFSFWKNFRDPTAAHIPIVGSNPEAQLFTNLRNYRFADGAGFDFSGDAKRNRQKSSKTLSDSNERGGKGFVPTFSMQRDFGGIIRYRLDWIFVKPPVDPDNGSSEARGAAKTKSVALLPENPQTFAEMNNAPAEALSDHAPITVTIPLPASPAGR